MPYKEQAWLFKGAFMAAMTGGTSVDYQVKKMRAQYDEPGEEWEALAKALMEDALKGWDNFLRKDSTIPIPPLTQEEYDLLLVMMGTGLGALIDEVMKDGLRVVNKVCSNSPQFTPYDVDNYPKRMRPQ